jgi:hypothetical protein
MLYFMVPAAVLAANTAEITTSDVRKGAAFDNIKASWGKALNIGDFKTNLRAQYDYNDNRDFLKECSLSGDLMDDGDMKVSYDLNHNFKTKNTEVSLSGNFQGTTLSADYDTENSVKEVSLQREFDVADQKLNVKPSWLVQAKTARVKMMSALAGGDVSAQVDYNTDSSAAAYEVGYARSLEDGKDVSAVLNVENKELEVEYVDNKFENGATWTAKATVPMDNAGNVMDAAKLTLKRAWSW